MISVYEFGKYAEKHAALYLSKKGYEILHANWYYNKREIDLVTKIHNTLVIIEVKARKSDYFGRPEEFVTPLKQSLLFEATDAFLVKNNLNLEVRFDIVSLLYKNSKFQIFHIEDAFRPL